MNVGNRMKNIRKKQGISADTLADNIGVSRSTVFRYEKGDIEKMPIDVVANVAEALHVSLPDLMGIENDSIQKKINDIVYNLSSDRQQNVYNYAERQLAEQNNNVVQLSDYTDNVEHTETVYGAVSAGTGQYLDHEQPEQVVVRGSAPDHDFAVKVVGNSMEPTFNDGQIVYVNKLINDNEIRNNQFVIAEVNGEAFIKKLSFSDDYVRLISLNPNYKDIIIHDYDDFAIRGIVVI